jgi:hypothetical protein
VFVHHDNAHKRIKALEKENAELREANKMLNERCKTCAYYLQTPSIKKVEKAEALLGENAALKARAEKAEAEVKDLMHDRAFLIAWLKSEGIKVKVGGKCEREGAGSEITIGSNTPLWEAEAKLAAIEKDLRERIAKYKSGRGKGGLYSILLKELDELLGTCGSAKTRGKHSPDKEPELCGVCGGKRGLCLCLEGTQKKKEVKA